MEDLDLVKCGIDSISTLIDYLSKDAIGSDFLGTYLSSREKQANTTEKQKEMLGELVSSSNKMVDSTKEIAEKASHNIERLNKIYEAITELRNSVARIENEHKKYVTQFKSLIEQTKNITKLVDDIQNFSEQTKLLSFNASIEAAHAGKAGAGFRIIANEVKRLSAGTGGTSDKIRENVNKLRDSISNLEDATRQNATSLAGLTDEADQTLAKFDKVRKINSENNSNVEKISSNISDNVQNINKIIQNVQVSEDINSKTVNLFADCASKNQMLFNDLYSLAYETKAVLKDLKK
ncbi:MAG: hypothetical protein K6F69_10340 [Treponema sp.]|nr:hypothetical protein [Treponema sp.]